MSHKFNQAEVHSHPSMRVAFQVEVVRASANALERELFTLVRMLREIDPTLVDLAMDVMCIRRRIEESQAAMTSAMSATFLRDPSAYTTMGRDEPPTLTYASLRSRQHSRSTAKRGTDASANAEAGGRKRSRGARGQRDEMGGNMLRGGRKRSIEFAQRARASRRIGFG